MLKFKNLFKKKVKKPFQEKFFTAELSFPARVYGTSGDLSKAIKVINSNKLYPEIYMGFGWDILLNLLGTQGFDASIQDIDDVSSIYDVKDLTSMTIGYKKWIQKKTA